MKIVKAIENLREEAEFEEQQGNNEMADSIKLGREALKRCKILAENNPLWAAKPLLGETAE